MADKQVFLSYSLANLETARHVARAIEARGWAISWERYAEPDPIATQALRQALSAADCVVVLWSADSVASAEVLEEARLARSRGILVQATLDDADVPMPFVLDEPAQLVDAWSVTTLVRQIERVLDEDPGTRSREAAKRVPDVTERLEARVLDSAEEQAEAGNLSEAIGIYERWVDEKPEDMKATRRLGDLYLSANREQDAAARYQRVAEHYAASGFIVPAIETYRRVVELAPYDDAFRGRLDELVEERARQTTTTGRAMAAVQFTLTAPPYVAAGETFLLDVWAHRDDDRGLISEHLEGENVPRVDDDRPAAGPALTARLHVDGLDVKDSEQSLRWSGGLGAGSFRVDTSGASRSGGRAGVIGIYVLGLQIARIHFLIQIGDATATREIIPSRQERHTRAIACFAPEDRQTVEARVRSFERAAPGVDVALDATELRELPDGFSRFLDRVSACDVLYLFWSENAARSREVEREWRYALRLRGIDFIDPVPLVSREIVPPPPELVTAHGDDWRVPPEPEVSKPPRPRDREAPPSEP